jgi:hypothetical protein
MVRIFRFLLGSTALMVALAGCSSGSVEYDISADDYEFNDFTDDGLIIHEVDLGHVFPVDLYGLCVADEYVGHLGCNVPETPLIIESVSADPAGIVEVDSLVGRTATLRAAAAGSTVLTCTSYYEDGPSNAPVTMAFQVNE